MSRACCVRAIAGLVALVSVAACGTSSEGATAPVVPVTDPTSAPAATGPDTTDAPAPPSAPTTGAPPTTVSPSTIQMPTTTAPTAEPGCSRLDDFDLDAGVWVIVNDGVMGGRSQGALRIDDSTLSFTGTVVTDGGGFTSLRLRLDGTEMDGTDRVRLRLRADDRGYGITFEDDQAIQGRRVSHGAALPTTVDVDADGFAVVEAPYAALQPSIFGRRVDADPFDPGAASEIGLIISDGVDGEFRLNVDWIDVCAASAR